MSVTFSFQPDIPCKLASFDNLVVFALLLLLLFTSNSLCAGYLFVCFYSVYLLVKRSAIKNEIGVLLILSLPDVRAVFIKTIKDSSRIEALTSSTLNLRWVCLQFFRTAFHLFSPNPYLSAEELLYPVCRLNIINKRQANDLLNCLSAAVILLNHVHGNTTYLFPK